MKRRWLATAWVLIALGCAPRELPQPPVERDPASPEAPVSRFEPPQLWDEPLGRGAEVGEPVPQTEHDHHGMPSPEQDESSTATDEEHQEPTREKPEQGKPEQEHEHEQEKPEQEKPEQEHEHEHGGHR